MKSTDQTYGAKRLVHECRGSLNRLAFGPLPDCFIFTFVILRLIINGGIN